MKNYVNSLTNNSDLPILFVTSYIILEGVYG